MRVLGHVPLSLPTGLEREAVEAIVPQVAALLATALDAEQAAGALARTALIVVSPNAGAATSLQFWAQAQRTGLALASPELFPWCLANAPCGALARLLHITGPNITLLGDAQAIADAVESAGDLLDDGRVDRALVVVLRFADAARPVAGHALLLVSTAHDTAVTTADLPRGWRNWL